MTTSATGTSRVREIEKEHAAVRAMMVRIVEKLDRLRTDPSEPGETWNLPMLVKTLRNHLKRHFEIEEGGGLLGAATEYYEPRARRIVEKLVSEHRNYEAWMDQIIAEIGDGTVPPVEAQRRYERELRRLLADLARHEAVENGLLAEIVRNPGRSD